MNGPLPGVRLKNKLSESEQTGFNRFPNLQVIVPEKNSFAENWKSETFQFWTLRRYKFHVVGKVGSKLILDNKNTVTIWIPDYSNHLNTGQVCYSNGPKLSHCWMVRILNDGLKTRQKCLFNGLKCPVFKWSA